MTLHYFGEMSCTEIGAFLGVSANTIKSRLRRAQQRLQKEEVDDKRGFRQFQNLHQISRKTSCVRFHKQNLLHRLAANRSCHGQLLLPQLAVVLLMLGFGNHRILGAFSETL